jgi:hypothetical protein
MELESLERREDGRLNMSGKCATCGKLFLYRGCYISEYDVGEASEEVEGVVTVPIMVRPEFPDSHITIDFELSSDDQGVNNGN